MRIRIEVSSTTFFIVSCASIGSSRIENTSMSRYWPMVTRLASSPIIPSSRALSPFSETGQRLESRAITPMKAAMTIASRR